ncbi:MAG TPA: hypothetical protein V6C76_00070 [Drouetiella sp.]
MNSFGVRPRRLLGSAFQIFSLSLSIGVSAPALAAESNGSTQLNASTSSTQLNAGTSSTQLNAGTYSTQLNAGTSSTQLNAGTSSTQLKAGTSSTQLNAGTSSTQLNAGTSSTQLNAGTSSTQLTGGAKVDALKSGAAQPVLNGGAAQSHKAPLQGGIKDDAQMRSSLRLTKPASDHGVPLAPRAGSVFIPGQVTQFSGGTSSGSLAPIPQNATPANTTYNHPQHGVIPPVSTYTMTRSNSRTWVAPGYEVTPSSESRSTASVPPSSSTSATYNQKGVTTWAPGFNVTSVTQDTSFGWSAPLVGNGVGTGLAAYIPKYQVHKITDVMPPTAYDPPMVTRSGVTSYKPGFEVTVTSRSAGVVTWTPGYEISKTITGVNKETLSGIWHTGGAPSPLVASQGILPTPQFTKILVPDQKPLYATTLLLPQLRSQAQEKLTWDDWYKRVANAVYCRWQYAEVCPGTATVRMVVTKDREVGCQLIDFQPAPDIKRDQKAETKFRESAVKAVDMVTKFEIPDLPTPFNGDKVVFDLDLRRTVDGPGGVDIASGAGK